MANETEAKERGNSKAPSKRTRAKAGATKPRAKRATETTRKTGRKAHQTRPTTAEKALIEERRALVYELVKARIPYRKISEHLKSKGYKGCSKSSVGTDFQAHLAEKRKTNAHSLDEWLDLELDVLDDAQSALTSRLRKHGKPEDIKALIAIQNQRDRYLQISKAAQSEAKAREALALFLGIEPEDLPDGDGGSNK